MSHSLFELVSVGWSSLYYIRWQWFAKQDLKPDSLCHIQHNKKHRRILQITENMTGVMKAYDNLLFKHRKVFLFSYFKLRLCLARLFLWASAMYHACYWDVRLYLFLDNGKNTSEPNALFFRHALLVALLQSCYNCRLTFPQLLFLRLRHQSTRFIALSKIVIPRDILLAIIHLSIFMLNNSNREDRELTNVGEMVRLKSTKRNSGTHPALQQTWQYPGLGLGRRQQ